MISDRSFKTPPQGQQLYKLQVDADKTQKKERERERNRSRIRHRNIQGHTLTLKR